MKSTKKWFESIEDPEVKRKALKNTRKDELDKKEPSLSDALYGAFMWGNSPEGFGYWKDIETKSLKAHKV